ncbi:MAG: ABC transporter ATP-binding protein [Bacillaceae bacterium]
MSDIILQTHSLSKKYKDKFAVDNVNMTIRKGQIYGFIGQNGAGKTTFIRIVTGLIHATSGEVSLLGGTSKAELEEARKHVGSLVESPSFYENMTARENLEFSRLVRNIPGKECIDEVLALVGLHDVEKKKVKNFSLGMKQRLGIANALLGNPRLLILDEPINGLDPISIVEIRELLKKMNREKEVTIIISSHILGELSELATHYGIIDNGKLIQQISAKELQEKCRQYIEIEVDDTEHAIILLEQQFDSIEYEVYPNQVIRVYNYLENVGEMNKLLSKNNLTVNKIVLKGQNLEEYFVQVVGGAHHA